MKRGAAAAPSAGRLPNCIGVCTIPEVLDAYKRTKIVNMLTDTTPEADAVLLQLLRQAPVWRKLQLMTQLNDMARTLALSGLRSQYPHATEAQLQRLLADRLLGVELAASVYGARPDLKEASRAI